MLERLWFWFKSTMLERLWFWARALIYGLIAIYVGIALLGYALQKGVINF